jgi:hypothetical protein
MIKIGCPLSSSPTLARNSLSKAQFFWLLMGLLLTEMCKKIESIEPYPCTLMLLTSLGNQLTNQDMLIISAVNLTKNKHMQAK